MARRRGDFPDKTQHHLGRSVCYHCSICGAPTAGPFSGGGKSIIIGHAAHIEAASNKGPRPNPQMSLKQRTHYDNGIWLCNNHGTKIDRDWPRYTVAELQAIKARAEQKAADDLDTATAAADLRPLMVGGVRWCAPAPNENRPGYAGLFHVDFMLGGQRKQRGRAYIEVDNGDGAGFHSTPACIARGNHELEPEYRDLRPSEPYLIPVLNRVEAGTPFWLDRVRARTASSSLPDLSPGTYITDEPFLNGHLRPALVPGQYCIRVRVVLGNTAHHQNFWSDPKEVRVS